MEAGGRGPLRGLRIVVTRAREQSGELVEELERLGAIVIACPLVRIEDPADPGALRRAAANMAAYDWIVFTSANGVERFWEAFVEAGGRVEALASVRFGCVGPATRRALLAHGVEADAVPPRFLGAAVAESIARTHRGGGTGPGSEAPSEGGRPFQDVCPSERGRPLEGVRVLLPLAAGAADTVERDLAELGASVERVEAYRTVPDREGGAALRRRMEQRDVDVLTFTSPSTVEAFVDAVGTDIGGAKVAVIGPVTEAAASRLGLPVEVVATEHSAKGLVDAIVRRWGSARDAGAGV